MSLNGVWVLEVAGAYGWERVSTAFLEKGRYLGGGSTFYSQGNYKTNGKKIKISISITRHGTAKTVFGEKRKQFTVTVKAKQSKNMIKGYAELAGSHSSIAKYPVRLLRQADILK